MTSMSRSKYQPTQITTLGYGDHVFKDAHGLMWCKECGYYYFVVEIAEVRTWRKSGARRIPIPYEFPRCYYHERFERNSAFTEQEYRKKSLYKGATEKANVDENYRRMIWDIEYTIQQDWPDFFFQEFKNRSACP